MPRSLPPPCRSPAHGLLLALALVCAPHTMGMGSQSHAPEQYSHTPAIQQPAICNSGEGGAMHMRGGGCFGFGVRQFIDTRRVPAPVRWPEPPESERAAPRARRRIAPPTDGIVRRVPGPLRIPGQLEIGTMVRPGRTLALPPSG